MTGSPALIDGSVEQAIRTRYSCRTYSRQPIDARQRRKLAEFISANRAAPFGSSTRFELVAATEADRKSLAGLGTYGFIKDPTGFLVGAVRAADRDLEDYGYLLERIVLFATSMGLGTCWLGGSFRKSNFAAAIGLEEGESLPAVVSVGYIAGKPRRIDGLIRRGAASDARKPWAQLFFDGSFDHPLTPVQHAVDVVAADKASPTGDQIPPAHPALSTPATRACTQPNEMLSRASPTRPSRDTTTY